MVFPQNCLVVQFFKERGDFSVSTGLGVEFPSSEAVASRHARMASSINMKALSVPLKIILDRVASGDSRFLHELAVLQKSRYEEEEL